MQKFFAMLSKALIAVVIVGMSVVSLQAQEYYAYTPNGREQFTVSSEYVAIKFVSGVSAEEQERFLQEQQLFQPVRTSGRLLLDGDIMLKIQTGATASLVLQALQRLRLQVRFVEYANPFFVQGNGEKSLIGLNNRLVVRRKASTSMEAMQQAIQRLGVGYEKDYPYDEERLTHYLKNSSATGKTTMELAATLHEGGLFEYAEPDYKIITPQNGNGGGGETDLPKEPEPQVPFDPTKNISDDFHSLQWALHGQSSPTFMGNSPGMSVQKAWDITKGSPTIKIAVLDSGVDPDHEDLKDNLLPGKDYTGLGTPSGGCDVNSEDPNEAHGTHVAGIIAALENSKGIVGVAPQCKIIPVKISWNTQFIGSTTMAEAFEWVYQEAKADIFNCSFIYDIDTHILSQALKKAMTFGRGGLGVIVVAASGNNYANNFSKVDSLPYPARQKGVIAIGATDPCDQVKTIGPPNSCHSGILDKTFYASIWKYFEQNPDGTIGELYSTYLTNENSFEVGDIYNSSDYSSFYGPELFACAPGSFIVTTDIMGAEKGKSKYIKDLEPSWTNKYPVVLDTTKDLMGFIPGKPATKIEYKAARPKELLDPAGNYTYFKGTSSSAPNASGVIALMLSANPSLTSSAVKFILAGTCDKVGFEIYTGAGFTRSQRMGYGRINAYQAVSGAASGQMAFSAPRGGNGEEIQTLTTAVGNSNAGSESLQIFPNPSNGEVRVALPLSAAGAARVRVVSALGVTVFETTEQMSVGQNMTLNLSKLSPGAYIVEAMVGEKKWKDNIIINR